MFDDWSPAQLAAALGFRINLVGDIGGAVAYLVGHDRRSYSHGQLCIVLGRLARMKEVDPTYPPITPRALRNGREQ